MFIDVADRHSHHPRHAEENRIQVVNSKKWKVLTTS